jgi:primosomal protein N' (replication factor Y)
VDRSAEELGRAFPGTAVVLCRPGRRLPEVGQRPAIVVATSGVEPPAEAGYSAAVLLDGDLTLARPDLRAGEEALRRWSAAAALVRPAAAGGEVVICADPAAPAVQALVRLDPAGFADRELDQRAALGLPPVVCTVALEGDPSAVTALMDGAGLADPRPPVEVLGPSPLPGQRAHAGPDAALDTGFDLDPDPVRVLVRTPAEQADELTAALRAAVRVRSARKEHPGVRVRVDPRDIG